MFKSVIFDMDGVIIDSEPIHFKIEQSMFKELGVEMNVQEHSRFVGATDRHMWGKIIEKYMLNNTVEDLIHKQRSSFVNYILTNSTIGPVDGVLDLMEDLHRNNIKMIIASSAAERSINVIMERFNINKYFHQYVCGDDVKNGKPAPDIFVHAADILRTKIGECIVIEDSNNGVLAAKAAGMKCVGYRNKNSGNQDLSKADLIVDSLRELNYNVLSRL